MSRSFFTRILCTVVACAALVACGGEISGEVSGLGAERSLMLQNNGTDPLTVTQNGRFYFNDQLAAGETYAVTVATQPSGQVCTVSSGSGTINSEGDSVDDVRVSCVFTTNVRGIVSGLGTGLSLTLVNGAATLVVTANGGFSFAETINDGDAYDVRVRTQPLGMNCIVTNGSGTFVAASFRDVTISCG